MLAVVKFLKKIDLRRSSQASSQRGYTMIEISLATGFVAIIIATLAATTTNIIKSYNKGIWLSQINQAGQQINADIGDKARFAASVSYDNASHRLCVSGVSYVWNLQNEIDRGDSHVNKYDGTGEAIRLVRIDDPRAEYCARKADGTYKAVARDDSHVRQLLGRGAAIQQFSVSGKQPLLKVSIVVSTEGSNTPVLAKSDGTIDKSFYTTGTKGLGDAHWQCGDLIEKEAGGLTSSGVIANPDQVTFKPASNQYCAFANYEITIFERSV